MNNRKKNTYTLTNNPPMFVRIIQCVFLFVFIVVGIVTVTDIVPFNNVNAEELIINSPFHESLSPNSPPIQPFSPGGTVKNGGFNAPLDAIVSAWCDGVQYATSPIYLIEGETWYSLEIPGDDTETPGVKEGCTLGETVYFYVDVIQADQTAPWAVDSYRLDLTYTNLSYVYLPLVIR